MSIIMDLFVRSHQHSKTLTDEEFWELIHTIDHEYKGDSEAVVSSLIRHLKKCEDEYIFAFDDKLSELVHALDGKSWAEELFGNEPFSEEKFLSARYAAVADGMEHYSKIIGHREKLSDDHIYDHDGKWEGETDGLMTAAAEAWSYKHNEPVDKYPHKLKYDVKSHTNTEMWQ